MLILYFISFDVLQVLVSDYQNFYYSQLLFS